MCNHYSLTLIAKHNGGILCDCQDRYGCLIKNVHFIIRCRKCYHIMVIINDSLYVPKFDQMENYNHIFLTRDQFIGEYLLGFYMVLTPIGFK